MNRMNREEFFAKLAPLDEKQAKQVLWTVYWRGTAAVRERIEGELEPDHDQARRRGRARPEPVDPEDVLGDVREFVSLARSGAYMGGDRRVTPKERTRWRSTFKKLVTDAREALRDDDITAGAAAMETLIDLACEMRGYDYFHSEDPVEAARLVVSDEVALLWGRVAEHSGFQAFAERAAPQLVRWEARYGWTRSGWGKISEKEVSLADVLTRLLRTSEAWSTFAGCYLDALDRVAAGKAVEPRSSWRSGDYERRERTETLGEWHLLLIEKFFDDEDEDQIDRLVEHPALGGPELTYLQAQVAHRRGDVARAHKLVHESLTALPGHQGFLAFAAEIGAPLPPHAQKIAEERARAARLIAEAVETQSDQTP